MTVAGVFGMVALVFYAFPYLGIIFAPLLVLYYLVAVYYRRSSIEVKRLDAVLRSALYASFNGKIFSSSILSYAYHAL
jgi:hypothetical protein